MSADDIQSRRRKGHQKGREMLKGRWNRVVSALEQANPEFANYVVEFAYGEVYTRPGLDMRSRELVAITCLTIQGLKPQLQTHILAALNVGVTQEELVEVFIHLALYVGFPVALFGLKTAREVFDRKGRKSRSRSVKD